MRLVLVALLVVVVALGVLLGYHNAEPVELDYLWGQRSGPLSAFLLAAFSLGVLLALLACAWRIARLRWALTRTERRLRLTETELQQLRNLQTPAPPATPQG
jgi:putative membrane protein